MSVSHVRRDLASANSVTIELQKPGTDVVRSQRQGRSHHNIATDTQLCHLDLREHHVGKVSWSSDSNLGTLACYNPNVSPNIVPTHLCLLLEGN